MHSKYKTFVLLLFFPLCCDNEYLPLSAAEEKAKEKPNGNDKTPHSSRKTLLMLEVMDKEVRA